MEIILIVYLVVSIALIGIILLQQGKGAEMGASFGAGGANTVFGAAGSGNALTKTTTILTILFFAIALTISYLNSEPAIIKDAILDDTSTSAPVEVLNLEAQLPTATDAGLAAEVAPTSESVVPVTQAASEATAPVEDKAVEVEEQIATDKDETKQ